jgi:hypothetical protein
VALNDETAVYTTATLAVGWHTVQAEYGGSLNFLGATNSLTPDQFITMPSTLAIANFNGSYLIRFGGIPDQTYRIEYTDNLLNPLWQSLGANTADTDGVVEYIDYPPQYSPVRYYRSAYHP